MAEEKNMNSESKEPVESNMAPEEENFFSEDEELKAKSKLPLIIGAAGLLIIVVLAIVLTRGHSLSKEDEAIFEEAAKALRSDNYANYPEAEKKLTALVEKYPEEPLVLTWLAQMYMAWGDTLSTEAGLIEPKVKEFSDMGQAILPELKTVKNPQKKEALEKALAEATANYKKYEEMRLDRNKRAAETKNKGFELVKKAIQVKKSDYRGYRVYSDYYRIQRNYDKALEHLEYVGKAQPESAGLRFIKGAVAMEKDKDYDKAIEYFDDALKKDSMFAKAKYFKGLALERKGQKEESKKVMEEVLKDSPNHPGAMIALELSTVFDLVQKQLDEARKIEDPEGAAAAAAAAAAEQPEKAEAPKDESAKKAAPKKKSKGKKRR